MKEWILGVVTASIAATSSVAFADAPRRVGTETSAPARTTTAATTAPAATTTTTGATGVADTEEPALTPSVSTRAPQRDTVTIYQSSRPNKSLLLPGAAIFVGSYATTAAFTASEDLDKNLYIPVAGPWLHLTDMPAGASTTDTLLTVGSGVLQGTGALLTVLSFLVPEKTEAATIEAGPVKMLVTPTAYGRGSVGFGATGTF